MDLIANLPAEWFAEEEDRGFPTHAVVVLDRARAVDPTRVDCCGGRILLDRVNFWSLAEALDYQQHVEYGLGVACCIRAST